MERVTCITVCKLDSQWELAVWLGKFKPGLFNNLESWDGKGGGREVQEGTDIYIYISMADSCWCLAETNTTVNSGEGV